MQCCADIARSAAEAAQREARLQAEIRSAKDARQRAEASEKKAGEKRIAAAEALRVAAAEARAAKAAVEAKAAAAKAAEAKAEPRLAAAAGAGKGIQRFDGAYIGRMCSINADKSPRCWSVALQVQNGTLSSTWMSRFNNNPAHAKGTIAADGSVTLALDGYTPNGRALTGNISGGWTDNAITGTGAWANGAPLTANWTRTQ